MSRQYLNRLPYIHDEGDTFARIRDVVNNNNDNVRNLNPVCIWGGPLSSVTHIRSHKCINVGQSVACRSDQRCRENVRVEHIILIQFLLIYHSYKFIHKTIAFANLKKWQFPDESLKENILWNFFDQWFSATQRVIL